MAGRKGTASANIFDQFPGVTIQERSDPLDFMFRRGEKVLETNAKIALRAEMQPQHLRAEVG